ncbi:MAG: hypothetical protein D6753_13505 [Planctomycetota bacterium]|nr:MAG: hypothetical protein D6753_13505 [Planctomycetota bacterium]
MKPRAATDGDYRPFSRTEPTGDGAWPPRYGPTMYAGDPFDAVRRSPELLPAGTEFQGRYRVIRCLGTGGFSEVYLAADLELDRRVAVKRTRMVEVDREFALREAKLVAALEHPGIVRIVDVLHDEEHGLLIVMQFVNGTNLARCMRRRKLSVWRSLEIVRRVALSLAHAHAHGIVHRDVKPANILIDAAGNPLLTDFGLAWRLSERHLAEGRSGTIRYMSPEQMRGENNRIDATSDVFSLGIVLYELLTDRLPFDGRDWAAVESQTAQAEFVPASRYNPEVTPELDAVLGRAMHRNPGERFQTMAQFAEALLAVQRDVEPEPSRRREVSNKRWEDDAAPWITVGDVLAPRGLRPYGPTDAEMFRDLLAGPRDANGRPVFLLAWRQWCQAEDGLATDRLGVLLGPPGSGKTSFVQAGLMAAIDDGVAVVRIECRPGDLSQQILDAICDRLSLSAAGESLGEMIKRLRIEETVESRFRKVVLVLDQYESWAEGAGTKALAELAAGLRQCDGARVQVLVVASDAHWGLVNRLTQAVEVPLVEGTNLRSMPLLSKRQARWILEAMGRGYGSLPPVGEPLEPRQARFLEQAIGSLGCDHGGRVLPIQIAMFAHVAALHHWDPQALQRTGGLEGLFVEFFEDAFESEATSQRNREILPAAARILQFLLPAPDQSVRESARSLEELEHRLGGQFSVQRIRLAVDVLVEELKVAIPVPVADGKVDRSAIRISSDFLVAPIRAWTQRVTQSTPAGRAQARFYELAGMWTRSREARFLPSTVEFLQIAVATSRMHCTTEQRQFLQAAGRRVAARVGIWTALGLIVAALAGLVVHSQRTSRMQHEAWIRSQIEQYYAAPAAEVPGKLRQLLNELPQEALVGYSRHSMNDGEAEQRAILLRAELDPSRWTMVLDQLDRLPPQWAEVIHDAVRAHPSLRGWLERTARLESASAKARRRAAISLLHLGDAQPLVELMDIQSDAQMAYDVIREATQWRDQESLAAWVPLLDRSNRSVRYCAAAVLGSFAPDRLAANWPEIGPRLSRFPAGDFTLRQVAQWLARTAGREMAEEGGASIETAAAGQPARVASAGPGDWYVSPTGLDMVRVDVQPMTAGVFNLGPGSSIGLPRRPAQLWVAATPVTRQLFARFQREALGEPAPTLELADGDLAQRQIAFHHAMLFCNWLSDREGLQRAYVPSGDEQPPGDGQEGAVWRLERSANGYRIPTGEEVVFAISGGVAARDTVEIAEAIWLASSNQASLEEEQERLPVWATLPNYLGLHLLANWQYPLVHIDDGGGWSHVMAARNGVFFGQRLSQPFPITVLVVVRDAE